MISVYTSRRYRMLVQLIFCEGARVVYLCRNAHYVDWYALFPPRLAPALAGTANAGARFVYHDNVYMYGRSSTPYTENTPGGVSRQWR